MLNPKDASIISDMVSSVGNLIQASAWSRIKTALVEAQKQSASPTNKQMDAIAFNSVGEFILAANEAGIKASVASKMYYEVLAQQHH